MPRTIRAAAIGTKIRSSRTRASWAESVTGPVRGPRRMGEHTAGVARGERDMWCAGGRGGQARGVRPGRRRRRRGSSRELDAEAVDLLGLGGEDGVADAALLDALALLGDPAGGDGDEAAEGLVAGVLGEVEAHLAVEFVDVDAGVDLGGLCSSMRLNVVGSAGSCSSLISPTSSSRRSSIVTRPAVPPYSSSDDRDVHLLHAEIAEQVAEGLGLGDEHAGRMADSISNCSGAAHVLEQVAGVEDADDVVERAVVDGDAGVAALLERLLDLVEGGADVPGRRSPAARS